MADEHAAGRDSLYMITIYENPADFPGKFVAREWRVTRGRVEVAKLPLAVADTLDAARAAIPNREAMACTARSTGDDPVIVETWL